VTIQIVEALQILGPDAVTCEIKLRQISPDGRLVVAEGKALALQFFDPRDAARGADADHAFEEMGIAKPFRHDDGNARRLLLGVDIGSGAEAREIQLTLDQPLRAELVAAQHFHRDRDLLAQSLPDGLLQEIERWAKLLDHRRRFVGGIDPEGEANVRVGTVEGGQQEARGGEDAEPAEKTRSR